MTTNASTLADGLPGVGGRITPAAALRHCLLVGRRDLLQVRSNPEDLAKGVIDRFRSLPIARSAMLAGRILADAVRLVASLAVILGVGMALGFRITTSPVAALTVVFAPLAIRQFRRLS